MASEPADSGPGFAIDDPEELSQKKRVNELLTRRRDVIDARDAAREAYLFGQASKDDALQYYRSRIESLILDLWTKFSTGEIDTEDEYLESKEIDTIRVDPPQDIPTEADDPRLAPGADPAEPKLITIEGLKWFLEQDETVYVSFRARTMANGPGIAEVDKPVTIPLRTLDKALIACVEFLDKAGIDADISQEEQQTHITRELLEEVEEWRQKNIQD